MQITGKSQLQVLPTNPQAAHATRPANSRNEAGRTTGGKGEPAQHADPETAVTSPQTDLSAVVETPSERVMQLRRKLAEGTYRVEGSRIAVQMMDETAENNRILKQIDTNA